MRGGEEIFVVMVLRIRIIFQGIGYRIRLSAPIPRGIFASAEVLQNGGTQRTSTYQKYVHRTYTEPNLENIYIPIQNKNKPGYHVELG